MQPSFFVYTILIFLFPGSPLPPFVVYWFCLVKRSRALLGSNSARNSQDKVRQGRVGPLAGVSRRGLFSAPWTPCHASKNPML